MKGGDSAEPPREVLSRFPRSRAAIRKLFDEDEEFRELCGDYADCLTILDQLRRQQEGAEERAEARSGRAHQNDPLIPREGMMGRPIT